MKYYNYNKSIFHDGCSLVGLQTKKRKMKTTTIGLISLFLIAGIKVNALDTLFYENFDSWNFIEIEDSIFTDYDEDGLSAANGLPGGWFVGNFANGGADTAEVVAISASWLEGFLPGNKNWLMLPTIHLGDGPANLSWRSAPALGNLYLDGYTVLVSTNQYFYYDINLADTLMHFAQNINESENEFSDGIIHTNFDYTAPVNISAYTQYPGLLSSWSADLTPYNNQTIYIGFLHNSDDDNFIAIDDILLTGTAGTPDTSSGGPSPVGLEEADIIKAFQIYPNVVEDELKISFSDNTNSSGNISVFDITGQLVIANTEIINQEEQTINVSSLESGIYVVRFAKEGSLLTQKIIKK